jgi:hypothetical protein
MDLKDRERKVDISKMPMAEVKNLSQQLGDRCKDICDEAANKMNAFLNIYGMSAKIAFQIDGLEQKPAKAAKIPAKKGRKPKQANLK